MYTLCDTTTKCSPLKILFYVLSSIVLLSFMSQNAEADRIGVSIIYTPPASAIAGGTHLSVLGVIMQASDPTGTDLRVYPFTGGPQWQWVLGPGYWEMGAEFQLPVLSVVEHWNLIIGGLNAWGSGFRGGVDNIPSICAEFASDPTAPGFIASGLINDSNGLSVGAWKLSSLDSTTPVPEPASVLLLGAGLAGLGLATWHRRRKLKLADALYLK